MKPPSSTITFACYNQVEFTQRCIDSLKESGTDMTRVVVVDNCSSDNTLEYLMSQDLGGVISNRANLGCGVAWNQGVLALQSEWTIVMNNDVVVSKGWLDGLIDRARALGWLVASPAMIEGDLDYDINQLATEARRKLGNFQRGGLPHAVCMAIHESVWQKVGFFRATPKLLGYEDSIFFEALRREGIPGGTVGTSWIHHFGSITQAAMKRERGLKDSQGLGNRYHAELGRKSWFSRRLDKYLRRQAIESFKESEMNATGMSLHAERRGGDFFWK